MSRGIAEFLVEGERLQPKVWLSHSQGTTSRGSKDAPVQCGGGHGSLMGLIPHPGAAFPTPTQQLVGEREGDERASSSLAVRGSGRVCLPSAPGWGEAIAVIQQLWLQR